MKKKIIVSVITTILSLPLFMVTSLANPKNVYTTPYGTYTTDYTVINSDQYGEIQIGPFVIYAVDKNVSTFKYQFNNYYTGTVTINTFTNINPTDSLASYRPEMYMDNCTMLSYTDTSVTFYIKNVKEFSATLVYPTGNSQFNIQAWANPGNTNITIQSDTQTAVNQILSYVQFINEDSFSIAADVRTIKNKLLDSLGYGNSDDTIESDFDLIHTDLETLKSTMTQIYYLEQQQVGALNRALTYATNNYDLNAYSFFGDNTQLSYSDFMPYYQWSTIKNNRFGIYAGQYQKYALIFGVTPNVDQNNFILHNGTPLTTSYFRISRNANIKHIIMYEVNVNSNWFDFTINSNNDNMRIYPLYWGPVYNMPKEYAALFGYDFVDTYTEKLDDVINAINNMSVNVNNLTVNTTGITYNVNNTQVNTSVNTYNTDIQNVYNVENNFSTTFDSYNQQFIPDFTETMTTIHSVPSVMNNVVVDLYNLPFIKYPILLTLAGIVLIALLGV